MKRLLILTLLFLGCWAQGQLTSNSPKATIRVESATLCPGQTADVAVYVDFGEYATKEGVRAMENFMFFIYLTDTSVCDIVYSYKRHNTGTGYGGKIYDYWVCEPVLKEMHPKIKCCMQNSYVYGTGWGNDQDAAYTAKYPKAGRFASTWFASERDAFMLTDSIPLFRIRIRCKKEGVCGLKFCSYGQMAFSTGLTYLGGQYFDFRDGIFDGEIDAKPGKGPDKSLVDAGRDSLLCVGARLTLNGEGGTDYVWTEISGKASQQNQFLAGSKTKNPTFTPQQEGTYRFQMAAFSPSGCSTLDTVVYTVGANTISQQALLPDWDFIDAGSSVMFRVAAKTQASSYPLTLTFAPDSLFAEGQNVFDIAPDADTVRVASLPFSEPNLVAATIQDKYGCKAELSSSVFIKGRNITGYLNPFPVYRCGNDNSDKSIQLNVLTKGGSGLFNYKWTATDLEGNVAAPVIDDPFVRSPRLTYQGLCAISVSIYDLVTGENVLISDTMTYRDWLHPSVEVVVDTLASGLEPGAPVGPFCEGRELAFKLQSVYPGEVPVYQWRINGITQENATDSIFSAALDHDDYVDVIMYSDEECVAERSVQSAPFRANVRYPVYMSASVVNAGSTGEDYLDPCFDSVKYRVLAWNTGTDYTVSWLRNGKDVLYEERVHSDNEEHSEVDMVLPRTGFYDKYSCVISDASMPCAVFNSITAEAAYLNLAYNAGNAPEYTFNILEAAELAPIQTNFAMQAACESEAITLTTDIRYLPRDFTMIWFKKPKDGGDSVFLGYYRFDLADEENEFEAGFIPDEIKNDSHHEKADFDLTYILGYDGKVTNSSISNSSAAMAKIRSVVENGFKLVLNDPDLESMSGPCEQLNDGFEAGDAVYYVLYTPGTECGTGLRRYRSEDFVPNLIKDNDYSDNTLVLTKLGSAQNCPTAPMVVVASIPDLPDEIKPLVRYEWRYDGRVWIDSRSYYLNPLLEGDLFPDFSVLGAQKDTLYVNYSPSNVKVTCRAILDLSCGLWGGNKYKSFDFKPYVTVGAPDFTLTHIEADTIVCAGSEVTLWAQAGEKNKTYKNKRKAIKAASEYEYAWGDDWASLPKERNAVRDHDTVVGMFNSSRRVVTPSPAVVPEGYWDDWNFTDGVSTYYLSVHHRSSDCWAYDSVQILSAPDKEWNVSLEPTIPGMWCDSAKTGPHAQKIYLNTDDPFVSRAWYLNGKRQFYWKGDTICVADYLTSDTLSVRVVSDLATCRPNTKILKMGIPYHESPAEVLMISTPELPKVGEKVLLEAGAIIKGKTGYYDNDYLHNVTYRWQKRENNGSWTELPASAHGIIDPTYNSDSTSMVVPEGIHPCYRVIAEGLHHLCPADTGYLDIPVAVPAGVSLDVVEIKSDGQDGQPIFGMCQQSDDYVKMTGVSGNTGTYKDTLFDVATGKKVRVRVSPQNPGAESWVMYYRNGKIVAAGPVGSARPNPRLPRPGAVAYEILDNGEYYDMALTEFDKVYVMYGTDTISIDGLSTHYSNRYDMWRVEPNGKLELVSDGQVVCPGGEVNLRAFFEDTVDYGHINKAQTLTWEPAEALQGTPTGWTAVGQPSAETVYKASAVDGFHCPWTDSLRIYMMQDGEEFSVPFKIASPDSVFCGGALQNGLLQAYIPDDNKGLSSIFSEVTFYVCDASGAVQASAKGLDSARLSIAVQDGWKAYASAKLKAACNTSLSYSDTMTFRAVAAPVIERISPLSKDTGVCASNPLVMKYAQPQDCGFAWHSVLAPMWGGDASLERAYRVDRNTEVVFEAYRNDLATCNSFDTVYVEMLAGGVSGQPSLVLSASADVSCGEKDTVTYTVDKRNCDTIVWYLNGVEAARDVLSFTFLPRYSGLTGAPDTVQVYGARAANVCAEHAFVWTPKVLARRVEKPQITYVTPDTTVKKNTALKLQAMATVKDGAAASFLWIMGEDSIVGRASICRLPIPGPEVFRVRVYQDAVLALSEQCYSEATVNVSVEGEGGDPINPLPLLPALNLTSSATWLCGEDSVINYTLSEVAGYDTLVWFENGLEIARDVWQLSRTLAYTGFDRADTVFVQGIAVDSIAPDRDTIRYRTSGTITVHHIEKPVFVYVSPRDTLVAGAEVLLRALAIAPDGPEIRYFWSDSLGDESGEGATFLIKPEQTQHYYVIAEQILQEMDAFECYAEDSVLVRVGPVKMGELEVYIPNTVIPYSQKKENTHLRVYGLNIKEVYLQVFNERSEKLYEGRGDAASTVWNATGPDGKIVPEGTYSYKATVIVVDSEGKEHTLNKQSWVQVIL